MHKHRFDINSTSLTQDQLQQAMNGISHIVKGANVQLANVKLMSSQDRNAVSDKINRLAMHAREIIRDTESQEHVDFVIKKFKLQSQQAVVGKRLTMVIKLVVNRIHRSSLTDKQRTVAINEIKTAGRFAREDMAKAISSSLINNAFTIGVSAINGALSKYVADSQINVINQIKSIARKIKLDVHKQKLPDAIKSLVNNNIHSVQQAAINDVMNSLNFIQLAKVRQQYINQLKAIAQDKQGIVKDLIDLDTFVRQMNSIILLTNLSSDQKLQAERTIDQYRMEYVADLKESLESRNLNKIKHQIELMIVNAVSNRYQKMVDQASILSKSQIHKVIDQIKVTTAKVAQQPKINVRAVIRKLRSIVHQQNHLTYRNQMALSIDQIKSQINQLDDVSRVDREYLLNQIAQFSQTRLQKPTQLIEAKHMLFHFFKTQCDFIRKFGLRHIISGLLVQINASYLNGSQRKTLRHRLVSISRNSKLNYSNKQLMIKTVSERILKLDRLEGQKRLSNLSHVIYKKVDTLAKLSLKPKFAQFSTQYAKNAQNASRLIDVDHQIQLTATRMSQSAYNLNNSAKSAKSLALHKIIEHAQVTINDAILYSDLKQLITNRFERIFNHQRVALLNVHKAKAVKMELMKLHKITTTRLQVILKYVKQYSIQQINTLVQNVHYQLMAYSGHNYMDELGLLREHAVMQIHHANNLLRVVTVGQYGILKINHFNSQLIDKYDDTKAKVHHQIDKIMLDIKRRLWNTTATTVKNRILMLINQTNERINRGLDKRVNVEYQRCFYSLDHVLRRSYLHTWAQRVNHVQSEISKLIRVPDSAKQRATKDIDAVNSSTVKAFKQNNISILNQVAKSNSAKLQNIIVRVGCLDPVKQSARTKLVNLIKQVKRDAKKYQSAKLYKHNVIKLNVVEQYIERKLSLSDSHQVQLIYQTSRKRLVTFRLKMVKGAQLNRFVKHFSKVEKQLSSMKFLSDAEIRKVNRQFNQCYHKTIYDIKHSPDVEFCLRNLKSGQLSLKQILSQAQQVNAHKQQVYQAIQSKIDGARKEITGLKHLQPKDKKSSKLLLKQAQQQASTQIKNARDNKEIMKAEFKGLKITKRVVNEVSSADVLLSAIQSANNQISRSALDKQQKQATLKQIHQIINNGIRTQILQPKPKAKPKKKAHKSVNKSSSNRPSHHSNTVHQKGHKHSIITTFINAIRHFFSWLSGKLAQAF